MSEESRFIMTFEETFPNERLRRARYLKGWTQSELAEVLDTDFETVSRWERGITVPNLFYREKLCDIFGKTAEELGLNATLIEASASFPLIFLTSAYVDAEQELVTHLKTHLQARGMSLWSSRTIKRHGAENRRKMLQEAIRAAQVILLIVSPEARTSRHVQETLHIAAIYRRRICALWIAGEDWQACLPKGCGEVEARFDARQKHEQTLLDEIAAKLEQMCLLAQPPDPPSTFQDSIQPRNPYKGLNAFHSEDQGDFFGRDSLLDELVTLLDISLRAEQASRLLAVVGPSGSGKSSVVLAGLLPRLHMGGLPGSSEWVYLEPVVPGSHPCEALVFALAAYLPERTPAEIRAVLERDAYGLHTLAGSLRREPGTRVVLFIDQFEEVFAQTMSEEERQHFIDLLVMAVTEPHAPTMVILTLRADFYDRPLHYAELGRLIETQHKLVLPMEIAALRSVIERPAALADVQLTFEGDLASDLLCEVQGQVGALPLLQFALDQLFHRRRGRQLTLQAYQEIGGVKGALGKWAEATYVALPSEEHRRLARALFLRLIDPGGTEQDTRRRRAALSELSLPNSEQTAIMQQVATAFIEARLLTTNEIAGVTTVEVSHEALIREWVRLTDWLRDAREDMRLQQMISKDVSMWEQRGKPRDRLYRGSQLTEARIWAKHNMPSTREAAFLRASTLYRVRYAAYWLAALLLFVFASGLMAHLMAQVVVLPATPLTMVTTLQEDGPGSLRQAIAAAKPGSTITFAPHLRGTILLASDDLDIAKHVVIRGPGANMLAISGGNSHHRIHVFKETSVTISGLTFKDSISDDVGFIYNNGMLTLTDSIVTGNKTYATLGGADGGGIYNDGVLTLVNSTVSANNAGAVGSGSASIGGGIFSTGTLTLMNSTVFDNRANIGGGIYALGKLTLMNSTIAGNAAMGIMNSYGGGIAIEQGHAELTFCTIADNTAARGGGLSLANGYLARPQLSLANSLVISNHASIAPGIWGRLFVDSYNLIQDFTDAPPPNPLNRALTEISGSTFSAVNVDAVLRNNGGMTLTLALLAGSPAIDRVPLSACHPDGIATDQRGVERPQGAACDMGAYEYVPPH